MRYIKLFERKFPDPEVGDYVICEEEPQDGYEDLYEFLKYHIGKNSKS